MVRDIDKYRADVLKLAGFALTIPAGKIYLDLPGLFVNGITHWFVAFYILLSLLLWLIGIIFVLRGAVHLDEK